MLQRFHADDRAAVSYVDVVLTFATLAAIAMIAPLLFNRFDNLQGVADPLTVGLFELSVPLLIIALIVSMGVAARA